MTSVPEGHHRPPSTRGLLIADVLVMALFIFLAGVSLKASRDAYRQRAWTAAENLADILQQNIAAQLTRVDTAMRHVVLELPDKERVDVLDPVQTEKLLSTQVTLVPELQGLRIADADGIVRFGRGISGTSPVDLTPRAFFRRARDDAHAGLVISEPILSRLSNQWVIVLARRLERADGAFAGVIYATLQTAHFDRLLSSVDLGVQGAASLRFRNLQLIARRSQGAADLETIGSTDVSSELMRAVHQNPERGAFTAHTALDQIERINAYRQVSGYPLLVLVGLGTEEYFAAWRVQFAQVAGLVLLGMFVVWVSSFAVHRARLRAYAAGVAVEREGRRHQALLHTASDGVHVVDRSGNLVEFSESFATMLGYSRADLAGRPISTWEAELPQEEVVTLLKDVEIGRAEKFETRHRRADGRLMDVEVTTVAVQIEGEDLIYCSSRDITERKRLARQLEASTAELRDLYEHAPCGYHSLDQDGVFLHVNTLAASWLGSIPESLIGQRCLLDFLTPEGRDQSRREFQKVKAGGRVDGLEFDLVAPRLPPRRVSLSATAVLGAKGEFQMTRTVMYDITELHAARERLRQLTREQQAMLDNELIGIVKLRDRRVVWHNQAMRTIFGYTAQDLMDRSLSHFHLDESSYEELGHRAYAALQAGESFRTQVRMRHKNGHTLWIDANGVMLNHDSSEAMWMLADITAIKKSQEQSEHMALHDGLTGLPNRLLLSSRTEQAMAMADRYDRMLALCYLDLDGFKQVNDAHGHVAGDVLLREVAGRLLASVRANDTVCRVGGDEFVVLLAHLEHHDECLAILQRIIAEVGRTFGLDNGREVRVSASIGVAFYPQDGQELQALQGQADRAMYQAKKSGKSRICFSGGEPVQR